MISEVNAMCGALKDYSAGRYYRLTQPIQASGLSRNLKAKLTVFFGIWNDPTTPLRKPYVLDFDDLLDRKRFQFALDGATRVTTASPYLAKEMGGTYCRTGVSEEDYPLVGESSEALVVWRGSKGWLRALERIAPFAPDLQVVSGMPWKEYQVWLRTFNRNIEILPSYDAPFERCKSPIKMLQAMCQGVPCIVDKLPPYGPLVAGEDVALVFDDPSEIPELVKSLDKDSRRRIGRRARDWVLIKHHIRDTYREFLEVWDAALNQAA